MSKQIIIVGGGASGLVAAIALAKNGHQVTLLEKLDRVGKKLLATGNGRCNLLNVLPTTYKGDDSFAQSLLQIYGSDEVMAFFTSLGLGMRLEEDGRIYPVSGHGGSVIDVLRLALDFYQVQVLTNQTISSLLPKNGGFIVTNQHKQPYFAHKVIIACGGKAAEKLGSDGSGYSLLSSLGHHLTPPLPALSPLVTDTTLTKGLNGIRCKAVLTLVSSASALKVPPIQEEGEILFTSYGISGIAAMAFAEYFPKGGTLTINFLPAANLTSKELLPHLYQRRDLFKNFSCEHFFTGLFQKLLGFAFFKAANIGPLSLLCSDLTNDNLADLATVIENFPVKVFGTKGFEHAQVTAGGIDTKDFSPLTMESTFVPGLYATGEILNVHGPCGGYNLLFAFATALAASKHIG